MIWSNKSQPFSCCAPLPSRGAASNEVPLTVKILTLSFDLIVVTAFPKREIETMNICSQVKCTMNHTYQHRSIAQRCPLIVCQLHPKLEKHPIKLQLLVKCSVSSTYTRLVCSDSIFFNFKILTMVSN